MSSDNDNEPRFVDNETNKPNSYAPSNEEDKIKEHQEPESIQSRQSGRR